eukprot:GILJ01013302.1.p1 GENE.GILJ01013302.1~~GILJ01013302.1.p1  ORF type:complete len:240 (-),score=31.20 GILJ01013302.1:250-969(-)
MMKKDCILLGSSRNMRGVAFCTQPLRTKHTQWQLPALTKLPAGLCMVCNTTPLLPLPNHDEAISVTENDAVRVLPSDIHVVLTPASDMPLEHFIEALQTVESTADWQQTDEQITKAPTEPLPSASSIAVALASEQYHRLLESDVNAECSNDAIAVRQWVLNAVELLSSHNKPPYWIHKKHHTLLPYSRPAWVPIDSTMETILQTKIEQLHSLSRATKQPEFESDAFTLESLLRDGVINL